MNFRWDKSKLIFFEDQGVAMTHLVFCFQYLFQRKREKEKKKRLSTTCGMTRLLGEGLKGDSGQRLLFICYSLSMSFIGIQHLLKSSNHNLKTSHYLHFSTEFYIVRKVERIILNFFWQKKKDPKTRERRVEKSWYFISIGTSVQIKRKKVRLGLHILDTRCALGLFSTDYPV